VKLVNKSADFSKEPLLAVGNYILFFAEHAIACQGLLINGEPVYCGFLIPVNGIFGLWTIMEKNSKHQFSIYSFAKKMSRVYSDLYGKITSYANKKYPKQIEWIERMGYEKEGEDNDFVILTMSKKPKEALCTVGSK
jgi:hypothetical protein